MTTSSFQLISINILLIIILVISYNFMIMHAQLERRSYYYGYKIELTNLTYSERKVLDYVNDKEKNIFALAYDISQNLFDFYDVLDDHNLLKEERSPPDVDQVRRQMRDVFFEGNEEDDKNLTREELLQLVKQLRGRLNVCQYSLDQYVKLSKLTQQCRRHIQNFYQTSKYQEDLTKEKEGLVWWRERWNREVYENKQKVQEDLLLLNMNLANYGLEWDQKAHKLLQIKPYKVKDIDGQYKQILRSTRNRHYEWSMRDIMSKTVCEHGPIVKEVDNVLYAQTFSPQLTWKESSYLWSDYASYYNGTHYPYVDDEFDNQNLKYSLNHSLTVLLCYSTKDPKELKESIYKYFTNINIVDVRLNGEYTDNGGEEVYKALQDVHTPYVMILDSSVVLTKHSRLDILAYALYYQHVDVVAGSEEDLDNNLLVMRCYSMKNLFGKFEYQRGFHNTFAFEYHSEDPKPMMVSGQICSRGSSYFMTKTSLLLSYWKKDYPLALSIQAFYLDIQHVYQFGTIPQVTIQHRIDESNSIYKPLQPMDRTIREKFGQEYNIGIYIDPDNRFTWMPYTPKDYIAKDNTWERNTHDFLNPPHFVAIQHEFLTLIDRMARELNMPYIPLAGGLLSIIDFGGIFPWEYDQDYYFLDPYNSTKGSPVYQQLLERLGQKAESMKISISNNGTYRPGTPCSLLKELQPYFQQQFNLTRYTLNLEVNGKYPCGRMARTDRLGPYIDLYDYYHEPGSDDSLPMKGPFKRIQFMGHFINIPSNWRELLQMDYGLNYFRSTQANTKSSPWPICQKKNIGHPLCLKSSDDIYLYIKEIVNQAKYWPRVE